MVSNTDTFHIYGAVLKLPGGDIILVAGENITITPAGGALTISATTPPNAVINNLTPWQPPSMADAKAPNNSVYFSTTANKLVYKAANGMVFPLY